MGISERKERERQQMRDMILEAAMRLFVEQGFEKTSLRKIAQVIEYSPATIYLYFKDKNELFYELHSMAFRRFREEFEKVAWIADPFERLRFIGRSYIEFGLRHPEHYDLMFIMRSPMESESKGDSWMEGKAAFGILEKTVKDCLEKGLIRPGDYRAISYNLWAIVHGICSLEIRERLKMYEEGDLELALAGYEYIIDGLKV